MSKMTNKIVDPTMIRIMSGEQVPYTVRRDLFSWFSLLSVKINRIRIGLVVVMHFVVFYSLLPSVVFTQFAMQMTFGVLVSAWLYLSYRLSKCKKYIIVLEKGFKVN